MVQKTPSPVRTRYSGHRVDPTMESLKLLELVAHTRNLGALRIELTRDARIDSAERGELTWMYNTFLQGFLRYRAQTAGGITFNTVRVARNSTRTI